MLVLEGRQTTLREKDTDAVCNREDCASNRHVVCIDDKCCIQGTCGRCRGKLRKTHDQVFKSNLMALCAIQIREGQIDWHHKRLQKNYL